MENIEKEVKQLSIAIGVPAVAVNGSKSDKKITVITADQIEIEIPLHIAIMSTTIRNMVEDMESEIGNGMDIFQLPNISSRILKLIITYLEEHHNHPHVHPYVKPEDKDENNIIFYSEFDEKFCDDIFTGKYITEEELSKYTYDPNDDPKLNGKKFREEDVKQIKLEKLGYKMLIEIILGANYMEVKDLLEDACKRLSKLANTWKTVPEVQAFLDIKDDGFTEEERKQIEEENKWIED